VGILGLQKTELLLQCLSEPDPMLSMLDWLCSRLMEAEISNKAGADNVFCKPKIPTFAK